MFGNYFILLFIFISAFVLILIGKTIIKRRKNFWWMFPRQDGSNAVSQGYIIVGMGIVCALFFLMRLIQLFLY